MSLILTYEELLAISQEAFVLKEVAKKQHDFILAEIKRIYKDYTDYRDLESKLKDLIARMEKVKDAKK